MLLRVQNKNIQVCSYYSAVSAQFFILGALYATEDYKQFFISSFYEIFGESTGLDGLDDSPNQKLFEFEARRNSESNFEIDNLN